MQGNGDYIPRQAAREAVWQILNGMGYSEKHNNRLVEEIDAVFDDISAADVRPVVRGKWEPSEKYNGYVSCSICHDCYVEPEWVTKLKWGFCPHCGARMEEI